MIVPKLPQTVNRTPVAQSLIPSLKFCWHPAQFLVPFATQFRYPGDIFEPPLEEALQAFENASTIVRFVMQCLNDDRASSKRSGQ